MSNLPNTSDEILASARNLIMSGGYNGFSYADISEVVGIRKASIHHHFPSKVDLVRELVKALPGRRGRRVLSLSNRMFQTHWTSLKSMRTTGPNASGMPAGPIVCVLCLPVNCHPFRRKSQPR